MRKRQSNVWAHSFILLDFRSYYIPDDTCMSGPENECCISPLCDCHSCLNALTLLNCLMICCVGPLGHAGEPSSCNKSSKGLHVRESTWYGSSACELLLNSAMCDKCIGEYSEQASFRFASVSARTQPCDATTELQRNGESDDAAMESIYWKSSHTCMGRSPEYGKTSHVWELFPIARNLPIYAADFPHMESLSYVGRLPLHGEPSASLPMYGISSHV